MRGLRAPHIVSAGHLSEAALRVGRSIKLHGLNVADNSIAVNPTPIDPTSGVNDCVIIAMPGVETIDAQVRQRVGGCAAGATRDFNCYEYASTGCTASLHRSGRIGSNGRREPGRPQLSRWLHLRLHWRSASASIHPRCANSGKTSTPRHGRVIDGGGSMKVRPRKESRRHMARQGAEPDDA
jgi:hypothetical protein